MPNTPNKQVEITLSTSDWTDVLNVLQICVQETARNKGLTEVHDKLKGIRDQISKQLAIEVKF